MKINWSLCVQVKLSPSGNRIAFTVVTNAGTEAQKGFVRELPLGCALVWDLAEIDGVAAVDWLGEDTILYTAPDASGRPHKACHCQIQNLRFSYGTDEKSSKGAAAGPRPGVRPGENTECGGPGVAGRRHHSVHCPGLQRPHKVEPAILNEPRTWPVKSDTSGSVTQSKAVLPNLEGLPTRVSR